MPSKYERALRTVRHRVAELERECNAKCRRLVRDRDEDPARRLEAVAATAACDEARHLLTLIEAVSKCPTKSTN